MVVRVSVSDGVCVILAVELVLCVPNWLGVFVSDGLCVKLGVALELRVPGWLGVSDGVCICVAVPEVVGVKDCDPDAA